MKKIFIIDIEDTKLVGRIDLLDWLCSSEVLRGRVTDRYWIVKTDTSIYNTYGDPDVNYLMAMLQRAQIAGYESLMIMKENVNRRTSEQTRESEGGSGQSEVQSTNPPETGEIPCRESDSEIPASSSNTEDSGGEN